jgi:hypothetical protein
LLAVAHGGVEYDQFFFAHELLQSARTSNWRARTYLVIPG